MIREKRDQLFIITVGHFIMLFWASWLLGNVLISFLVNREMRGMITRSKLYSEYEATPRRPETGLTLQTVVQI